MDGTTVNGELNDELESRGFDQRPGRNWQIGTTIGLGLLFDTLVVRSLMTPSIAALLGPWFWWPLRVRSRPMRTHRYRQHYR
jgi:uncharacterized membrane protein YdfJ with MMPL/SSD domain